MRPVDCDPALYAIAEKIREGYGSHPYKIPLKIIEAAKNRRYIDFSFAKPLSIPFPDVKKYKNEALSNAGIDPELGGISFRHAENNQVKIQIPLPKEEWEDAFLEDFIPGFWAGVQSAKKKGITKSFDLAIAGVESARLLAPPPLEDLSVPFLASFNNGPIKLNLSSGTLVVGSTKGGKSSAIVTILLALAIIFPPNRLRFSALLDFKQGLALRDFDSLPHSDRPVITEACEVDSVFEEILLEVEEIGEKFKQANVREIQKYNKLCPQNPLPWKVIVIDEMGEKVPALREFYAKTVKLSQKEGFENPFEDRDPNYWVDKGLRLWRAYGYVFVIGTQNSTKKEGLDPDLRINFGSAAAFRGDERLGALAFGGTNFWSKKVFGLGGGGDCILKQEGSYFHGVGLYTKDNFLHPMLKALCHYDCQYLAAHPRKQLIGFSPQRLLSASSTQPLNRSRSPVSSVQRHDFSKDDEEGEEEAIEPIPEPAPKPVQKSNQELSDQDWERIDQGYEKIKQVRLKRPRWTESLSSLIVVAFGQNANSGGSVKKSRLLLKVLLDKYEPSHPALRQLDSWLSDRKLTEIGGNAKSS